MSTTSKSTFGASLAHIAFPLLDPNGSNYPEWAINCETHLVSKGLILDATDSNSVKTKQDKAAAGMENSPALVA